MRPHSSLGNLPPAAYAKLSASEMQRDGALRYIEGFAPRPVASPSHQGSNEARTPSSPDEMRGSRSPRFSRFAEHYAGLWFRRLVQPGEGVRKLMRIFYRWSLLPGQNCLDCHLSAVIHIGSIATTLCSRAFMNISNLSLLRTPIIFGGNRPIAAGDGDDLVRCQACLW